MSWLIEEEERLEGESWKKLREKYAEEYKGGPVSVGIGCGQIWNFVYEMEMGDIILVPTPQRTILIAEGIGDYEFKSDWSDDCNYAHRRKVKWLREVDRDDLPERARGRSSRTPLVQIQRHNKAIERSGFCPSCRRVRSEFESMIAERNVGVE